MRSEFLSVGKWREMDGGTAGSCGGVGREMDSRALATVTLSRDRHSHLKTVPDGVERLGASM